MDATRDRLLETLVRLLEIPSPTGSEQAMADHVQGALESIPHLAGRVVRHGSSVVLLPPSGLTSQGHLLLVGHLDTVPGQIRVRVEDDRLYGRGASDMKAGIACMLELARELKDRSPGMVLYDREEGPYHDNGLEPLLQTLPDPFHQASLALVLEPTGGGIRLGALGTAHVVLTVRGEAAHSARPWLGVNAIHRALPLLADIAALGTRTTTIQGLEYRESVSITKIQGGQTRNVIPDTLVANVNVRFSAATPPERAIAAVLDLAKGRAEAQVVDLAPAAPPFAEHPVVQTLARTTNATIGPKQAWTDVARLADHGIPAVNFGPGDPNQAHKPDEHVSISAVWEFFRKIYGFLKNF